MNKRLYFILAVFMAASLAVVGRLFYWQVIKSSDLRKQAKYQYQKEEGMSALRGSILANDGSGLVTNKDSYTLYADKFRLTEDYKTLANKIAPLFVESSDDRKILLEEIDRIENSLKEQSGVWIMLQKRISPEVKNNIDAMGFEGLNFEKESVRDYPEASISAHLLGFLGKKEDGGSIGYFGLEGYYNSILEGKSGLFQKEKDALGETINLKEASRIEAVGGVNLVTNLDKTVQIIVEHELIKGIEKYSAKAGSVIVMNPFNGAIYAMSSYPSYDPSKYWEYEQELYLNPVISYSFEPGSVFKIIIMASALDAEAVKPDTICDICDKPFKVDKYLIETWDKKYHKDATMTDVIVNSDNVGMSFISQKLGIEKLYGYLDKFGLGKLTDVDLQGELTPKLRKMDEWNVVDLATASFGQGIAITPIQMIKAASIIANGGYDIKPQVVDSLFGEGFESDIKPEKGDRVISEKAAKEITAMMVEAAKKGEAKWTYSRGFKVAGKTGTAQIPLAGHYDEEKTIASFVGFAPSDKPKFIMLVTLQEPQSSQWASETAAPLWYKIASELFSYYKIQPED